MKKKAEFSAKMTAEADAMKLAEKMKKEEEEAKKRAEAIKRQDEEREQNKKAEYSPYLLCPLRLLPHTSFRLCPLESYSLSGDTNTSC